MRPELRAKPLRLVLVLIALVWNLISIAGSFYFPFFSPRYQGHPVAEALKAYWYIFGVMDAVLIAGTLSLIVAVAFLYKDEKRFCWFTTAGGIATIAKGVVNTAAYSLLIGGITPSFLNIFNGLLALAAARNCSKR